ncbi:Chloride channel protein CLC-a [Striga hermonthica]|uniref:Chloride channel protein n=1 Tax=Striga hermonthica TaxID=68872 RepID=A0A9N7MRC8_STRHE|nr:Chloride channel protein CLC-a [Striga hermonthica]
MEDLYKLVEEQEVSNVERPDEEDDQFDPEINNLHQPLLKRNGTLSSNPLAIVGAKVSHIESLDYEINENDLFKHDWRSRSRVQVLQYIFLKWFLAFLVGLLTGVIATLINLAIENIAGYKLLGLVKYIEQERYLMGFVFMAGANFILTLVAAVLCVCFAPTAAGPGIPEIKAYLNGVDTPNMDRRDLITCGSSSGVCAAFRAPVGGVLFALEEVATWWRSALLWRTFFSTAVVVVVLRAVMEYCKSGDCGLFGKGGLIMFDVSGVSVRYHVVDIIPVAVIGVLGGLLGSLYNYTLHKVLKVYNVINNLSVSVFTSICLYGLPFLAQCRPCQPSDPSCPSSGHLKRFNCPPAHYNDLATLLLTTNDDAVRSVFSIQTPGQYSLPSLVIFFALYCILGLITFGIAVPSGLFLPIILMGSAYGRILGLAMGPYTKIDPGLYAVLGAASLMAGSMRMTVSLCVIFLELTNNLLLLPITMLVLLIAKTVGDCFNPSIYEIILELKGLPFLDAHPEPWMRNITVGELADVKPAVVSLNGVEKVGRIVEVLKNTTHNGFPVVDTGNGANELHGLVLRAHLLLVLKKKWFLGERRRTDEWEVREKFTSIDLAERGMTIDEVAVRKEEMEMYVDLHPLTNTTPYTVVESMSVAKAMVLFRQVGLRHMLVLPKYQAAGVFPVVGILTRQDLIAHNILSVFPHLESKGNKKEH